VRSGKRESLGEWDVFSLDLNTVTESPLMTVFSSEFQTAGVELRKMCFAKVVVVMVDIVSWWLIAGYSRVVDPRRGDEGASW